MIKFEYFDEEFFLQQARFAQHVDALESFNRAFMRVQFIAANYAVEGRKVQVIIGRDIGRDTTDFVFGIQELLENGEPGRTLLHGGIIYHGPGENPSPDAVLRHGSDHQWQIHT